MIKTTLFQRIPIVEPAFDAGLTGRLFTYEFGNGDNVFVGDLERGHPDEDAGTIELAAGNWRVTVTATIVWARGTAQATVRITDALDSDRVPTKEAKEQDGKTFNWVEEFTLPAIGLFRVRFGNADDVREITETDVVIEEI